MNITPQFTSLPLATVVNPATDNLRRDNTQREVIAQPAAAGQSAAEKGVASEREKFRPAGQGNQQVDFAAIQEQAEKDAQEIDGENSRQQSGQQEASQQDSENEQAQGQTSTEQEADNEAQKAFIEQQEIARLQSRDREVRAHEQAHASVGGAFTGAPKYSFEKGPDGKKYAVEGEVAVDLSTVDGNPRATIAKLQKAYSAALAPANPSTQDTRVAAQAAQLISQAQAELVAIQTGSEDTEQRDNNNIRTNQTFTGEQLDEQANLESSQSSQASSSQSIERDPLIDQRADRIENFYSNITQAYNQTERSQFELTA